jgi:tetratricopeptide (TPR) repeat protein
MNLSVIERMARDGDMSSDALQYLLDCRGECEWLDYKQMLHLERDKELCDFTKDVLALKNVGGGYIIVGVRDKTWIPVGIPSELSFDSKMLRDQIRRCANVELDMHIVHHRLQISDSTGLFAMVFVRSSRKRKRRRVPTVVGKDFAPTQHFGLHRGDIYVRNGDSTVKVQSEEELSDLLDDLEAAADQDALVASGQTSPFAIEDGTYRLLEKGYESFVGRHRLRQRIIDAVTQDPRIWIINVHGAGGVGKSALVNWAVYEFYRQQTFEAIIHLTAKQTALTSSGIVQVGRSLYSLENLVDQILNAFQETLPEALDQKKCTSIEILSAWHTLLVLDNMETVQDGRILDFIQHLPVDTKAKVLMTSRQKTGAWELPVPVNELNVEEVAEFLRVRVEEMGIDYPEDSVTPKKVHQVSGGLPLAIQWILGRYRLTGDMEKVLGALVEKDSPVLEFSFRNIWTVLSSDARAVLAAMTVFDNPPTSQQIAIATQFGIETIDKALGELSDVTLATRHTQVSDGSVRYVALPITLSFAQHQLEEMGDFEVECRQRYQRYCEQMKLQESEIFRFRSRFEKFGLETDNEKKAAILCQRGESEMFVGNVDNADMLFKQARELAPQSAYIYAMSASYDLARNRIGQALQHIDEACKRATKKTGALCYTIKARILDIQRDRYGRLEALTKAIDYDPDDMTTRHQYGVALSRVGQSEDAIKEFTTIIDREKRKSPPTATFLMALKTRMINLRRLNREEEMRSDLEIVDTCFKKYPHLVREAQEFEEFRDN